MTEAIASKSTAELLEDWAAVMRELRRRGIVRTNNNPVGDIAEAIAEAYFPGCERGSFSQKGWDVKTAAGERVQVKAMRRTETTNRRNLSPIRDSDYDVVLIVIFDESFRVTEGLRVPRTVVEEMFVHKSYVNGRIITVTDALRGHPEVSEIDLSEATKHLHSRDSVPAD